MAQISQGDLELIRIHDFWELAMVDPLPDDYYVAEANLLEGVSDPIRFCKLFVQEIPHWKCFACIPLFGKKWYRDGVFTKEQWYTEIYTDDAAKYVAEKFRDQLPTELLDELDN
jgi:hypothetical protein